MTLGNVYKVKEHLIKKKPRQRKPQINTRIRVSVNTDEADVLLPPSSGLFYIPIS